MCYFRTTEQIELIMFFSNPVLESKFCLSYYRYLRETLKFIDKDRIGIWGKGYGGYATGMILAKQPEIFRCGISTSPITSWAHYGKYLGKCYLISRGQVLWVNRPETVKLFELTTAKECELA